jgi:hypothetical protein
MDDDLSNERCKGGHVDKDYKFLLSDDYFGDVFFMPVPMNEEESLHIIDPFTFRLQSLSEEELEKMIEKIKIVITSRTDKTDLS